MKFEFYRIDSHPIAAKFYALMREIETLPADTRQTDLIIAASKLRDQTESLMNDPTFQAKMIGNHTKADAWRLGYQQPGEPCPYPADSDLAREWERGGWDRKTAA